LLGFSVSIFPSRALYSRGNSPERLASKKNSFARSLGAVMRVAVLAAAMCLSVIGLSVAADAQASMKKLTNIPAQGLGPALKMLAKDRGFQVVFRSEVVGSARTRGASGDLTTPEALTELLKGTDLGYSYLDDKTVTILPRAQLESGSAASPQEVPAPADDPKQTSDKEAEKNGPFRLAQSNQGLAQSSSTVGSDVQRTSGSSEKSSGLTEIVVTAQKKAERLQDVPMSITVLDPQTLAENGQDRLVDYFYTVPGLNLSASAFGGGGGTQYLTIRGLSSGFNQNPTVGTVIDDIPVSGSSNLNASQGTGPDLDPSDLAQIEVLKGPQGTLYGANSIGGLIKYVTADPSTTAFSGRVEVAGVDVPNGGLGYGVRAAANIPISDTLAIRVSGFSRRDPGYIDDLTTGKNNFNSSDTYGGRVALMWRPSEDFSIKLSGLVHESTGNASLVNSDQNLQFPQGDLRFTGLPNSQQYTTRFQLYAATINAKFAGIDFVSLTGYSLNFLDQFGENESYFAQPAFAGGAISPTVFPGATGPYGSNGETKFNVEKLSQEFRLSSSISHWFDWRLGAFYTREDTPNSFQNINANSLNTGAIFGQLYTVGETPITFSERALFGDGTLHLTKHFDIEFGLRYSWNRQESGFTESGPLATLFYGVTPYSTPPDFANGSDFLYQAAAKYSFSENLMAYTRVATGYRIGGPNSLNIDAVAAGAPATYKPDTSTNYEIGLKGNLLDNHLRFDVAAYYVDWHDFQINVNQNFIINGSSVPEGFTANAGNAKSEGIELAIEAQPIDGLTIDAQGSYDHAVLTQDLPATSLAMGSAGDPLPYSMRFSGGISANQDVRLPNEWIGFFGGAVNYIGSRPYEFMAVGGPPRITYPGYTQLNLRLGARHDRWKIAAHINNVTDKRAIAGVLPEAGGNAVGVTGGYYATVIQPRTVGLSVAREF
jgi:iron complex outermembrane receptor protein